MYMNVRFRATALLLALLATTAQAQRPDRDLAVGTANPLLTVTTQNPTEVNIGKPATFVFVVKNEGKTSAMGVMIETSIPERAVVTMSDPKALKVDGPMHTFQLGDLAAGESRNVTLVTVPSKVALIELNSTITFATRAGASLVVRQPKLTTTAQIAPKVVIGSKAEWIVRVTNVGDGPAEAVTLTPSLVEGQLEGQPLANAVEVGLLKAGESKNIKFSIQPTKSGKLAAHFVSSNPDGLKAEHDSSLNVLQAQLALTAKGPRVQPMGRNGDYEILITNPGDTPTGRAIVTIQIPEGLEITSAADNAWDEENRSLKWRITTVRPGDEVALRFQAETNTEGSQTITVTAEADYEYIEPATTTHTTRVISRPNPIVTVVNDQEFTAVGSPISFKIMVVNAGSKVADQLRVRVAMPEELQVVEREGYKLADKMIEFPPLNLQSGEKVMLPFFALGTKEGEHRVQILLDGSNLSRELSFESFAFCYADAEPADDAVAEDSSEQAVGAE
jgi:uncharacterized repeat protein (TIGR01451 family)